MNIRFTGLIASLIFITACKTEAPEKENEEEVINRVTLTFTSNSGSETFSWFDPDGEGTQPPQVDDILLVPDRAYTMSITLENTLDGEDLTEEVREEGSEHMFFFGFGDLIFSDPVGAGNLLDRNGAVNYGDQDEKGLPIGLETSWTTGTGGQGSLEVILKHQPGQKTATSTVQDGSTDVDITFQVQVE